MECVKQIKCEQHFKIDGKKIRITRIERGWTLEELSKISRVTRKTIGEIESGKKIRPRFSTVEKIAVALRIELDCICTQNEKLS